MCINTTYVGRKDFVSFYEEGISLLLFRIHYFSLSSMYKKTARTSIGTLFLHMYVFIHILTFAAHTYIYCVVIQSIITFFDSASWESSLCNVGPREDENYFKIRPPLPYFHLKQTPHHNHYRWQCEDKNSLEILPLLLYFHLKQAPYHNHYCWHCEDDNYSEIRSPLPYLHL